MSRKNPTVPESDPERQFWLDAQREAEMMIKKAEELIKFNRAVLETVERKLK